MTGELSLRKTVYQAMYFTRRKVDQIWPVQKYFASNGMIRIPPFNKDMFRKREALDFARSRFLFLWKKSLICIFWSLE